MKVQPPFYTEVFVNETDSNYPNSLSDVIDSDGNLAEFEIDRASVAPIPDESNQIYSTSLSTPNGIESTT